MEKREENVTKQEKNNFPVRLVLLLSKSCGFCVELLKRNIESLLTLDAYLLYKEDRPVEFTNYMARAKTIIDLQHPELKQHESITPLMLIINKENDSIVSVILGFTSIENVVNQLINKSENKD